MPPSPHSRRTPAKPTSPPGGCGSAGPASTGARCCPPPPATSPTTSWRAPRGRRLTGDRARRSRRHRQGAPRLRVHRSNGRWAVWRRTQAHRTRGARARARPGRRHRMAAGRGGPPSAPNKDGSGLRGLRDCAIIRARAPLVRWQRRSQWRHKLPRGVGRAGHTRLKRAPRRPRCRRSNSTSRHVRRPYFSGLCSYLRVTDKQLSDPVANCRLRHLS